MGQPGAILFKRKLLKQLQGIVIFQPDNFFFIFFVEKPIKKVL